MKKYLMEFIGTFFLVLTVGLTGNPIAIGAVLAAMVYMGAYVSGAHYNPAVTLALWVRGRISAAVSLQYMLWQLLGALVAAGAYALIDGNKLSVSPAAGTDFGIALLVEVIFTFALVSVVLHVAASPKTKGNEYYGLAIGLVLIAAAFAGGPISGGAFNPAVGLGPNLFDLGSLSDHLSNLWLYLVGPLAGGILASLVFGVTKEEKK